MNSPRTILLLHSGRDWVRGSERVLLDLATNLPPSRFRPVVWCNSPALRRACGAAGVAVLQREFPAIVNRPWWRTPRPAIGETLRAIRETAAGLLHVNMLECLPWSLRAARRARIPVIAHLHIPTTLEERIWSGLHQATLAVGVSRFVLSWGPGDGADPSSLRLIYNGVVPERLERGDATLLRSQLGIPSGAFLAVTVGSLIPRKDVGTVIEGIRITRAAGEDVRLLILGTGELQPLLELQARKAGLAENVYFLGDRSDVGAILRDAADLLISAALEEALPLNLIEAGYFGLPSLVSDIPPHREILADGIEALFPVGTPEVLAERLATLVRTPSLRRKLGQSARIKVRESFLAERCVAEFAGLYEELTALPRVQHRWLRSFRIPACYLRFGLARLTRFSPASK